MNLGKTLRALSAANIAAAVALAPQASFSWGSYGHEQVNAGALGLLPSNSPLARCFVANNRDVMIRYAITPDAEWKMMPFERRSLRLQEMIANPSAPRSAETLEREYQADQKIKDPQKRIFSESLIKGLRADLTNQALLAELDAKLRQKNVIGDLSIATLKAKSDADRVEHSVHFFEVDAYVKNPNGASVLALSKTAPFNSDKLSPKTLVAYQTALAENRDYVNKIDPSKKIGPKPSGHEFLQHGSAPWRANQLFLMGIDAMKKAKASQDPEQKQEQMKLAMLYLGTMGHYVGDMSQPFHASLNYDGQAGNPPQHGIHHNYEAQILDDEAKAQGKPGQDKKTGMWKDLSATHGKVVEYGRLAVVENESAGVVSRILAMVASGYDLVDKLMAKHTEAVQTFPKKSQSHSETTTPNPKKRPGPVASAEAVRKFREMVIEHNSRSLTVLESAEMRMGDAAALLSSLWMSAAQQVALTAADVQVACPKTTFSRDYAILKYAVPNYYEPLVDFQKQRPAGSANATNNSGSVDHKHDDDGSETDPH